MFIFGLALWWAAYFAPGHFPPWLSFHNEILAAAGMAAIGLIVLTRERSLPWPRLATLVIATACVPLMQLLAGQILFGSDAVLAALFLVGLGLSMVIGNALARTRPSLDTLLGGLAGMYLAAAIAAVGIALTQWIDIRPLGVWGVEIKPGFRPGANLAQPNHFATLVLIGLLGASWLYQRRKLNTVALMFTAAFLCFGLALAQSRVSYVTLLGLIGWTRFMREPAALRVTSRGVGSIGLLLLAMVLSWAPMSGLLHLPSTRTMASWVSSAQRDVIYASLLDAISRSPWVGYGWNQVSVAQASVALDHPSVTSVTEHAHNLALDLMLWNGIPLGTLLISALAWWFWRQIRSCRDAAPAHLLAMVGVVFMHAMVEYPLDYAYFLLPVGLMMGATEALTASPPAFAVPRWVTAILAGVAIAITCMIFWEYAPLEDEHLRMRFETVGIVGATQTAPEIHSLLLTQPVEFIRFARSGARRGMSSEELASMRRIAERVPYPSVLFRYALANGLNGQAAEAQLALARLCKLSERARCDEGRAAWANMAGNQYPELAKVPFP